MRHCYDIRLFIISIIFKKIFDIVHLQRRETNAKLDICSTPSALFEIITKHCLLHDNLLQQDDNRIKFFDFFTPNMLKKLLIILKSKTISQNEIILKIQNLLFYILIPQYNKKAKNLYKII